MIFHRNKIYLLLTLLAPLSALANSNLETTQLDLIAKQIGTISSLLDRAKRSAGALDQSRYRFDYEQFSQDLQRLRRGLRDYETPARAQPNDLTSLSAVYSYEAARLSSPHEHD